MKVITAQEKETESRGTLASCCGPASFFFFFSFFAYQLLNPIYTPFLTTFYTFCFPMTYRKSASI